jgi:hypothetical protein
MSNKQSDKEKTAVPVSTSALVRPGLKFRWILLSSLIAAIVGAAINLVLLISLGFEPGPFMVYWILPALAFIVFLSVLLVNLKGRTQRLAYSIFTVALSIPTGLVLVYLSVMVFLAYGLATSP